ncbi:MAG TPA: CPBP family intramembrane glutamic endopeptidase [Candidatus Bathyarchaeia archaeon]|nr:CPBP family intramembrane glutamic endopeptidase [Candidatus Bathyarchaeia archaeon]
MAEKMWTRSIINTCGEAERESKSRKFNIIEAFAVMTFTLVVLWVVQYPFGVLLKMKAVNNVGNVLLFAGAMYLLFVSPFVHRDTLASWGLGDPVALWRRLSGGGSPAGLRDGSGSGRLLLGAIVITVTVCLAGIFYWQWVEASDFLFDMKTERALEIKQGLLGKAGVLLLGLVLATFLATCVIRYDNFFSALFTAIKIIAVLGGLLYLAAIGTMGTKAFADFHAPKFALDVFGYVIWGAIQQLLFCSYFGTRIRKGFAPAQDPARRTRKRFWVAVLTGLFFGLIHINSWYLVAVTWLLGIFLSYVFMADKNRNLIALGFVHGFLGSSVGWLFSRGKGNIEVEMGVGPGHIHGFDLPTVLVVAPLIIGFMIFMIYAWRTWREE